MLYIENKGWMRRGRKQEDNVIKATYAYYANGSCGSFDYYTEEECKDNVEVAAMKLELARYVYIHIKYIYNHFTSYLPSIYCHNLHFNSSLTYKICVHQADVKAAFLQSNLSEQIHLIAPPGYESKTEKGEEEIWEL